MSNRLRTAKYTKTESDKLRRGSFSIPALIKVLVGDKLTLENICIALHYEESRVESIRQLYSWYQIVLYPAVESVEGGTVTKKRKLDSLQFEAQSDSNVATILRIDKLKNSSLADYLIIGICKSRTREEEKKLGWNHYTDAVRLHLPYWGGEDYKLEIWLCSSVGRDIVEKGVRKIEDWRSILGDYVFEGMIASKYKKEEEKMGNVECTGAITLSFANSDCKLEVMLNFERGVSMWSELYSM